eukprot:2221086-Pleurochrysis_carterae.AAC.1
MASPRAPTRTPTASASSFPSSGTSVAAAPLMRSVGTAAPFRLPTVRTPGSTASLIAISSAAGTYSVLPVTVVWTCTSMPPPSAGLCLATARPSHCKPHRTISAREQT